MSSPARSTVERELLSCLDWSRRDALRTTLRTHPLVHLRAPSLRPAEIIALAGTIGTVQMEPRVSLRLPGFAEILMVGNVRDMSGRVAAADAVGLGIHSDRSFRACPPAFTMLYAVAVPARGGDTEFWNLYRLYADCDRDTRRAWRALDVEHDTDARAFADDPDRRARHPLVPRHPDTGRRVVYASPRYARRVIGVPAETSDGILRRVEAALGPPDVIHRWRPHDILVWDNRAVAHRATPYDAAERRELWRLSIALGSAPAGAAP